MKLEQLLSPEKWIELQKDIFDKSGFNVSVFDDNGTMISNYKEWANQLCPVIRNHPKGKEVICVAANNNISLMAMKTKKSVPEECDAGLIKLAIPVFSKEEFLGTVSCCGLLPEGAEVDAFLIHKMTGINEDECKTCSQHIPAISDDKVRSLIKYIEDKLSTVIPVA